MKTANPTALQGDRDMTNPAYSLLRVAARHNCVVLTDTLLSNVTTNIRHAESGWLQWHGDCCVLSG